MQDSSVTPVSDSVAEVACLADTRWLDGLLRQFVRDEYLVEDLRQETIARALRHPAAATRPWMARVARNLALSFLRGQSRRRRHEQGIAEERLAHPAANLVEEAEHRRAAVEALLDLDEPYRSTLLLRYMKGFSPREVAGALGVPIETVRTRLKRGLVMLRARLGWTIVPVWPGSSTTVLWGIVLMKTKSAITAAALLLAAAFLAGIWLWSPSDGAVAVEKAESGAELTATASSTSESAAGASTQREQLSPPRDATTEANPGTVGALLVRLRWGLDGTPARGIGVRVRGSGQEFPRMALSGEDGLVRFDGLQPGDVAVGLARLIRKQAVVTAGGESVLDIVIPEGRDVYGSVVDADGQPVPDAEILSIRGGTRPQWVQALGRTDEKGRFSLRAMHNSNVIGARAEGHAMSNFLLVLTCPRRADGAAQVELRLPGREATLRGVVRGPDGDPVVAAWVKIGSDSRGVDGAKETLPPFLHLRTDRDGGFVVRNLRAGKVPVRVCVKGLLTWRGVIECEPSVPNLTEIQLTEGARLEGRVVDGSGAPIAGVELDVPAVDEYPSSSRARTDADGRFRLANLPGGVMSIQMETAENERASMVVSLQPDVLNLQDLTFPASRCIQGLLLDERDRPLAGWFVTFSGANRRFKTDADGRFRVTNCGDEERRILCMQRAGFEPAILIVPGVRPRLADYTFRVPDARMPSATIAGRLLDSEGRALAGGHLDLVQVSGAGLIPVSSSGADGRFRTRQLPPGRYVLRIAHPNHERFRMEVEVRRGEKRELGDVKLSR